MNPGKKKTSENETSVAVFLHDILYVRMGGGMVGWRGYFYVFTLLHAIVVNRMGGVGRQSVDSDCGPIPVFLFNLFCCFTLLFC